MSDSVKPRAGGIRPLPAALLFIAIYFGSRVVLEATQLPLWVRACAACGP